MRRERVLVLIIVYKFAKGGLWLALALVLAAAIRMGLGDRLRGLADHLRHHAHAWSLQLAQLLTRASSRRGLATVAVALVADGIASLIEGWALLHGRWWGPWLVVVTTASLLPFEIAALARHPHAVRFALFAVNIAIVYYLARKAVAERRMAASAARSGARPSG